MTPVLFIDLVGIVVGFISIVMMMSLKKSLGGRIASVINMVVGGVLFNILAFGWTVIFIRLKLLPAPSIDVHHLLMTVGMILFVVAAKKFASLMQP